MSHVRLYLDEDAVDGAFVAAVRARGVGVTIAAELGMTDRSDEEHLAAASSQGRILFSFNASDYCRIHTELLTQGKSHAGIILAPQQRYSIGERVRRLLNLIAALSAEQMHNRIEFLSNWPADP